MNSKVLKQWQLNYLAMRWDPGKSIDHDYELSKLKRCVDHPTKISTSP